MPTKISFQAPLWCFSGGVRTEISIQSPAGTLIICSHCRRDSIEALPELIPVSSVRPVSVNGLIQEKKKRSFSSLAAPLSEPRCRKTFPLVGRGLPSLALKKLESGVRGDGKTEVGLKMFCRDAWLQR